MKKQLFICLALAFLLASCREPARISVENRLPGAELQNIEWGPLLMSSRLLPGQESQTFEIGRNHYQVDLPETHSVTFYLSSNGGTVFLETTATFSLDMDDDVVIVIDEDTEITNVLFDD